MSDFFKDFCSIFIVLEVNSPSVSIQVTVYTDRKHSNIYNGQARISDLGQGFLYNLLQQG